MPDGLRIVAIIRDGEITYPLLDTRIRNDDSVILFSVNKRGSELAKVLGKNSIPEM